MGKADTELNSESDSEDVVALIEKTFDDPETAIAALEAGLAAEPRLADWPSPEDRSLVRARLLMRLGETYERRQPGGRGDNHEKSLSALDEALLLPALRDGAPALWAQIQHNLGRVYFNRVQGDRADNIERAIAANEAALAVRTREAFPADWAKTLHNLAMAYRNRIRGVKADNIERAIGLYEAALEGYTREAFPNDWALTQNNLANAYQDRIRGEKADNFERAIGLYEAALEVYTREAFPADWAMTQHNLANAWQDRIRGVKADNIERAIGLYEAALEVRTRKAFPNHWAMTQNNLANAYQDRIRGEKADNIERAIGLYEAALEVRTRKAFPADWAMTLHNLTIAYKNRIRGVKADNFERAIGLCEAVLEVYTRETFPYEWARTQHNLATAYQQRIRGVRADNLERAIGFSEAALEVRTREAFPGDWARTQHSLAIAYRNRIRGETADNIERAISLYEAALEVRTREVFPYDWAATQHGLALAYQDRIHGAKADNIGKAIGLCEAALEVGTRTALPREHLETTGSLGQALLRAKAWARASDALEDARETFCLLLGEGLDESEARGLIAAVGPLFSCASFAAAEQGETERAFALACEGKARLLATALRLQRLDLPPDKSARLDTLRTEIREQSRLLERVEGLERTSVLDRLAKLRGELAGLIALSEARTDRNDALAQAGRICADGSIAVAPVLTEIGGKVFVVTPSQGRMRPTLDVVDLPELTAERLRLLMQGDAGDRAGGWLSAFARDIAPQESKTRMTRAIETIGEQLWSLLTGPLERALAGLGVEPEARLVFLPSAGFGLLPLGLAEEPMSGRHLIESREIVYAPSLDAIDTPALVTKPPSLAAIVNLTGDLIHTPIEGAFVAGHFQERNRILLDAHTASPDAALASLKDRSHWHFATHGLFDLDEARRSKLAMAEGSWLSVGDLLEAEDLGRPRLVVLSACETGLHDIAHTPEEFIGFPGAFMTMGAQAVLGTLWPVDDCASTLLTARFYDGHLRDGLAPAAALRQAQLWLRSATRDDLYAYTREAAHRSHVEAGALRPLERAIEGAEAEMVRFFAMPAVNKDSAGAPPSSWPRDHSGPARPFAHPIYWGGFVMTGR